MASTSEAARLTEAHRLAQARLGAGAARQMVGIWPLLDVEDIDATAEAWLRVAIPIVRGQHEASARLAVAYLRAFRAFERPGAAALKFPPIPVADPARTATSLTVTGPIEVKSATARGVALARASALGQTGSARAAMRLALDGGRQAILDGVGSDPEAHGWARATSGEPCAFCAMLASRGPAFSEESVGFEAHDGCSCSAEPVYDRDADWPAGSRQYADLWQQATAADGNTTKNFRQLVES